jgi:TPR repeat protein
VIWYHKAAEPGLAKAQYNLGVMYADGQGVGQDDAEAVMWVRNAAKQGLAEAIVLCKAFRRSRAARCPVYLESTEGDGGALVGQPKAATRRGSERY